MRLHPALSHLLAPVPPQAIELPARWALQAVLERHPALLDRLGPHGGKRFVFIPSDLPFRFEIVPAERRLSVRRRGPVRQADVRISGPIFMLLALLEGRLDGDAVFFSRALSIEGDTEAILALRNAMDDSDLDLPTDLAAHAGPFGPMVRIGCGAIRRRVLGPEAG